MSEINIYRVSPRNVREFTLDCLYAGLVPFIQSSPGMGKSSIVRSIAKQMNLKLIDHRLSTSAPEDLSGLPRFNEKNEAVFAPFAELFPLEGTKLPTKVKPVFTKDGEVVVEEQLYDGWMIFLDEFNSAHKAVQAAAYKLILDRQVGQHNLHQNCVIVAAGNLATDRAITNVISTAMQSRVIHLEMEINFDEWLQDVALKEHYDSRIIAYLSQYPSKLMDFQPNHSEKTFCCPRTWEFMDRLIRGNEVTDRKIALYAGAITSGVAADFVQFTKVYATMPKIEDILATPKTYPVPSDLPTRWAIISSMLEHVNADNLGKLADYVERFDTTFRILFFRSVNIRQPELRQEKAFTHALVALQRYLKD